MLTERRCRLTEIAARRGCEASLALELAGKAWPMAPGRWLAVSASDMPAPDPEALAGRAALVDVSGAYAVLRLAGSGLASLMPALFRLDLTAMKPGDVARTPMAQVPVILAVVDAAPTYDLLVPSTFPRHCAEALAHAAAPYGGAAGTAQALTGVSTP